MDHKQNLEELNKQALEKLRAYAVEKNNMGEEHQQKLQEAKNEWQASWQKLMDVMMVLENLEL